MKLRSGIKLLAEIEGSGSVIQDNSRCDAVLKFYQNHGEPLDMETNYSGAIPHVCEGEHGLQIAWKAHETVESHIVIERDMTVSRGADILPGIYYTLLGMCVGGYRHVKIPPHLYAHSMHEVLGIDRDSVIKLECFLTSATAERL